MYQHEINLIVSSDPTQGAINASADGSSFELQLETPLVIPKEAKNVTCAVEEATVWWSISNIITGVNDKLYVRAPSTTAVMTNYVVTIPQGLYDISSLNTEVQGQLRTLGAQVAPSPVIALSGNVNSQRVVIAFNYNTVQVDFSRPDTFRSLLGFNSAIYGAYAVVPYLLSATGVAQLNPINYFLIHSDLVTGGLLFNGVYNQTIGQVLINVEPASQIISTPFNPPRSSANNLAGALRSNLRFYLTDDRNRPVNTNGEIWSARISIKYLLAL